ncbi:MAG: ABC transporter permease subunit [Planctomycetes bacterium]|nr:ABC transporter permease subunit [Planctomycetota bacterium]
MKRPGLLCGLYLLATAIGFFLLLCAIGWLMRPDLSVRPPSHSPEAVREAREARAAGVDPARPPILWRDVDYRQGKSAPWYPKGESPILAELVAEGKLPPVHERVGEEPCVVEGVEGTGTYGGTWVRLASSDSDASGVLGNRMSYATLVRWSPQGYPIVPHVAKSFQSSADNREFVFALRKGMKWSDGHPFTADDILYWWKYEALEKKISGVVPPIMQVAGETGSVEKIDDYHVRFTFPKPNGLFLARLATVQGALPVGSPEHYLKPYHPVVGDPELIRKTQAARRLPSPDAVYRALKDPVNLNPEHPRLWPWLYRTYKPNPPQAYVRNPYYFMVDTKGNQLPYVDRLLFDVKAMEMIGVAVSEGQVTMQERHLKYEQYTLLMSQRERSGYRILHWYPGDASLFCVSVNLNLRVDPDRPDTSKKSELLNDKRFRQALSLAIHRRDIIDAEWNNQGEPAQCAPGPASYFHDPVLYKSFTEYDPGRANRLLDAIGLTRRDYEGYRTFPDGTRMTFYLNLSQGYGTTTPGQFIVDDWAKVGVRTILRERARTLFYTEKAALEHDFNAWIGNGEFMPMLEPRFFVPVILESNYAIAFAKWYARGGLYGDPLAQGAGCAEPPPGHPLRRAMEIYERACAAGDRREQREIFRDVLRIAAENVWTINVATPPPAIVVVRNGFRNVPPMAVASWDFQTPGNAGIETYYFEKPSDSPGAVAQTKQAILEVTPAPDTLAGAAKVGTGGRVQAVLGYAFLAIALLAAALVSVRHPYVGRRLLIMVPTLLVISVVGFAVIQLPPGDFVTSRIMQLQQAGDTADLQQIEELKAMFHLEESVPLRYARWMGLVWFTTFDAKDAGLLQGHLGRSMENGRPVNDIVGDRILLTVLMMIGTILFTWVVAIPTGIYSAARQYSFGDYALTLLSFIGMGVPGFLLALVLMALAWEHFGIEVSGLFSAQYSAQPEWTWGKVLDLLKHIWVPIVVLGIGGTASMIRIMRGNLLDELRKPYVTTARAKGVRPLRLLLKYPVRLALNPFISGIGGLFPEMVSGGAIVSIVLSLPMVGPLQLSALMTEDTYLAGSMLMVLSVLGVLGTLISDLLLLWLDPRIRFKGGAR